MTGLIVENGRPVVVYDNEASLRDGLAQRARLAGWTVETERHLPGWGRLDLWLTGPSGELPTAVEIKLDLRRAANIRKAFQQADAYARALGPAVTVILTAPRVDHDLATEYDLAYDRVWFLSPTGLIDWMDAARVGLEGRHWAAWRTHVELRRQLDLSTAVLGRLVDRYESPLAPRVMGVTEAQRIEIPT